MAEISKKVQERLEALASEFRKELPGRFQELKDTIEGSFEESSEWSPGKLTELRLLAHKLAGSGATFGFDSISSSAKELEEYLDSLLSKSEDPGPKDIDRLSNYIDALGTQVDKEEAEELEELPLQSASTDASNSDVSSLDSLPGSQGILKDDESEIPEWKKEKGPRKIIHLVDRTGKISGSVAEQLGYYGYDIEEIDDLKAIRNHLEQGYRRLLIVNTGQIVEDPSLVSTLSVMKQRYQDALGVICVGGDDAFQTRLLSVQAGGDAFFLLPLDIGRLVDRLDTLITKGEAEPYHILIVDDDQDQVAYYAFLLQQAGMITSVASDPRRVLSILVESKPELILMDMYMPGCSGIELAALLRQHEAFVGVPIVFLSFESNKDKQMEAICRGGDDFLTKPIKPEYLLKVVKTRVERNRGVRYFMERDSLTGLLNHTNLKEQLRRELLRSSRSGMPLSFAMIDVDHFKRVNDTWGHLIGDRVLKNLARLLQDRLRRTDIIGRYGGEEFGVIFLNTKAEDALPIMEELRENFGKVKHQAEGESFSVTFSCGIAGYPSIEDPEQIGVAADKALYEAKETGRNRSVLAKH